MSSANCRMCALVLVAHALGCGGSDPPAAGDGSSSGGATSTGGPTTDAASTSNGGDGSAASGSGSVSTGDASDTGSTDDSGDPIDGACVEPAAVAEAPPAQWINATGNLAGMASECGNLGRVVAVPCSTRIVAAVATAGLWSSDDAGDSWQALGGGEVVIDNRSTSIVFDPLDPDVFWETGLFGSGVGLYRSDDGGASFAALGSMTFSQLVALDFADPTRSTLLVGTHGQKQQVHWSADGGATWTNVGINLPADAHNSESPVVIDAQTFLVGACGYGDGVCGIYRSADTGATWTRATDLQTSHFGAPLRASDGAIYWPMFGDGGLAKSDDAGLTWTQVVVGTVIGVTPLELPDGSIVSVGLDHLMRSSDGGAAWQPIGEPLPFSIAGGDGGNLTYSAAAKTFFLSHNDCENAVLPDAIVRAGFDPA